ncbi:MAG: monoheme cytochrome C [Vicingaceae bacterium]|nr:monoheme cytochrome C [Vicingaceae bacterium]
MGEDIGNREELLAIVDRVVKIIRVVFIVVLLYPFAFYVASKIDFEKEKIIEKVVEIPIVENGIDVESGLIVDQHYELVKGTCSACHSINLVTQNSATREGWKDLIVWMQKTQKLWDLGDDEVLILDYLEKNYAPKEQGRRAPLKDIEWYEL